MPQGVRFTLASKNFHLTRNRFQRSRNRLNARGNLMQRTRCRRVSANERKAVAGVVAQTFDPGARIETGVRGTEAPRQLLKERSEGRGKISRNGAAVQ
jgi:hypothetical protein